MGDRTGISWTESTWNPWHGCHQVSPGCANCYMFRDKRRFGQDPERVVRSKTTFTEPLEWTDPALVFTCSWSDWFIAEADPWRDDAWDIIRRTPHLTYQILTKRPARIAAHLPSYWPLPNVWLGVSVESSAYRYRMDVLRRSPAAVRFVSFEPLLADLGPLDLQGIDWAIFGGESGASPRPMELTWLVSAIEQCRSAGVAVFVKQDSATRPGLQGRIPDDLWIKEFPRARGTVAGAEALCRAERR